MALSDRKLARLGREYDVLHQQIKSLEEQKRAISQKVIAELDRRGTKAIEADGVRVSVVRQQSVVYNTDMAKEVLGPRLFKKVQKVVVDPGALAAAQQAGDVSVEQVAEFSSLVPKSAYISIGAVKE